MSSNLPVPKCRIEIFREPGFFNDHFWRDWTCISGAWWRWEDEVEVIGNGAVGRIEKAGIDVADVYNKLIVRVTTVSGTNTTWGVKVYYNGAWHDVWTNQTGTGVFEATLSTGYTFTKVALLEEYAGTTDNYVIFDYVAFCKNSLLTPVTEDLSTKDVLESLEVTLPILSRGLGGAKFKLPNFNAQYTGAIHEHDVVLVWLYRTGETFKKVFGGRISKLSYEGIAGAPEYYIYVECMDFGDEMQVSPSLLQKAYTSINGKTIIKDAVALCSYLSDYGVDQGNAVASTHSYVFDEKTPWNVVRDVVDACQTSGGAVGFDGYVDAPGNLWIFPRNSSNSTVDLTDKILRYKIDYDTYRVKNKIKVYGTDAKRYPTTDQWCESTTDWSAADNCTIKLDSGMKKVGTYSIQCYTNVSLATLWLKRACSISVKYPKEAKKIYAWYYISVSSLSSFSVELLAPDESNKFSQAIQSPRTGSWGYLNLDVGLDSEANWEKTGSPDWSNIQGIKFVVNIPSAGDISFHVDDLHFENLRYSSVAEDSTSQGLYGVRMPEPITDDSLTSDDDCTKKAQSLLSYYKDKVTTLTLTTFGDNNFKPGDRQHVVLSNDNIDDYFRILEIRHTLQDVYWQTELLMSNEPVMIDYVFRKMFEAQKTLQTNI